MNAKAVGGASLSLLVAVDGSAHSDAAVHWLASLGTAQKVVRCVILNVQKPVMAGEVGAILPASVAIAERTQHAEDILKTSPFKVSDGQHSSGRDTQKEAYIE